MFPICCYFSIKLDKINNNPERISKTKPFIEQYN